MGSCGVERNKKFFGNGFSGEALTHQFNDFEFPLGEICGDWLLFQISKFWIKSIILILDFKI
ncbi:hypothetical protein LV85_03245 [Algoriphagus chordae]|uniref:Uncharacterized protein n=1 Tax=Algoriphagus chordae TaxID=237019 RepID=A0A2W7QL07_9BACT|nr:hypothetical protein LV85_03245 [Algoriphagus chordae]